MVGFANRKAGGGTAPSSAPGRHRRSGPFAQPIRDRRGNDRRRHYPFHDRSSVVRLTTRAANVTKTVSALIAAAAATATTTPRHGTAVLTDTAEVATPFAIHATIRPTTTVATVINAVDTTLSVRSSPCERAPSSTFVCYPSTPRLSDTLAPLTLTRGPALGTIYDERADAKLPHFLTPSPPLINTRGPVLGIFDDE